LAGYLGQQFGEYRLTTLLGKGGFAEVYLGEHATNGSKVAVKVFTNAPSQAGFDQLRDEARRMDQAARQKGQRNRHILPVYKVTIERGIAYLLMEYAPNGTVKQHFRAGIPFALHEAIEYVRQVAEALQAVHDAHLVHRDVKPANLLFNANKEILLSDFGIARDVLPGDPHITLNMTGTPGYMGPEQLNGRPSAKSDQYSFGVIAYEWLTGLPPFGGGAAWVNSQHLTVMPALLTQRNPSLPPKVSEVVLRALNKNPDQRWPSVRDFADALAQAAQVGGYNQGGGGGYSGPTAPTQPGDLVGREAKPGTAVKVYDLGADAMKEVFWLADGWHLGAIDENNLVRIWDTSIAAAPPQIYPMSDDAVLSPNRAFVARPLPAGTGVEVYDLIAQKPVTRYTGHTCDVTAIAWSPNMYFIASVGVDKKIHVWEAMTGRRLNTTLNTYNGIYDLHTASVTAIAWSFQSTHIVSCDEAGYFRHWNAITGAPVSELEIQQARVTFLKWSPDHRHILLGAASQVWVWDTTNEAPFGPYPAFQLEADLALWSPRRGRYVAARTGASEVTVWSMDTQVSGAFWKARRALQGFKYTSPLAVRALAWSPKGNMMLSGGAGRHLEIWKPRTGRSLLAFRNPQATVLSVSWAPTGRLIASGGTDNQIHIWVVEGLDPGPDSASHDALERTQVVAHTVRNTIGQSLWRWLLLWAPVDAVVFSGYRRVFPAYYTG